MRAKRNSQQAMNSNSPDSGPDIIDLDPASVTDHDKPAAQAAKKQATAQQATPVLGWLREASPVGIAAAALVIGAVAGGWAYRDYFWHYLPNAEINDLVQRTQLLVNENVALKEEVAGMERLAVQLKADIDANESILSSTSATAKSASASIAGLNARIEELAAEARDSSGRIEALAAQVEMQPAAVDGGAVAQPLPANLLQRLDALEKDVASLKAQKNDGAADTALLSQSLSDLKAKIAAGAPFNEELARLDRLVPAAPGLEELAQYGRAGILDAKGLGQELAALAAALPAQGELQAVAPPDDSWTGWALDALSSLITIRVAGTADWKKAAEDAAALAGSGDLQQAVEQLGKMEGGKPPGIAQWLEKATARLAVESRLKSVEEAVLRVIAAKG